jgi:hypothetical protein
LVAKDLNWEIVDGMEDTDQNIIMLKFKYENKFLILCVIYGPNGNCNYFFKNISSYILHLIDSIMEDSSNRRGRRGGPAGGLRGGNTGRGGIRGGGWPPARRDSSRGGL